jgi:hypothetical protein
MKASDVRNWLGIYFLLTTVLLGSYILLFGETTLLPIKKKDSMDAFQIIVPVFVAQLTAIFRWFSSVTDENKDEFVPIPSWVVKIPPLLVIAVIVIAVISMIVSEHLPSNGSWMDATTFKSIVTFCVTILNTTTVVVIIRFFGRVPTAPSRVNQQLVVKARKTSSKTNLPP